MNIASQEFLSLGLATNSFKTKVLVSYPHTYRRNISWEGYLRLYNKDLPSFDIRMDANTKCYICKKKLKNRSLKMHLERIHGLRKLDIEVSSLSKSISIKPTTFTWSRTSTACPHSINNCLFTAPEHKVRFHFAYSHPNDRLHDPIEPLFRCDSCGIYL